MEKPNIHFNMLTIVNYNSLHFILGDDQKAGPPPTPEKPPTPLTPTPVTPTPVPKQMGAIIGQYLSVFLVVCTIGLMLF